MHIPWVRGRYGVLLEQYLRTCGNHREQLGHQMFVMAKLQRIASKVRRVVVAARGAVDCSTTQLDGDGRSRLRQPAPRGQQWWRRCCPRWCSPSPSSCP